MARRTQFTADTVEAIAAGVAHDPNAPAGEWYVREGSVWRSDHAVVQAHPDWFVPLGEGATAAPYFPPRETAA